MSDALQPEQDRVLDFGGFPGRWEVTRSTAETGGDVFETRWDLEEVPEGDMFVHVHPHSTERFEVLSGVLEIYEEGEWFELTAGESYSVEPGVVHSFRNTTPVELVNAHEPALGYEEFFRRFEVLATEHGVSMPPDGITDAVLVSMLITEYDEEFRSTSPPQWLLGIMARLGRLRGYTLPE